MIKFPAVLATENMAIKTLNFIRLTHPTDVVFITYKQNIDGRITNIKICSVVVSGRRSIVPKQCWIRMDGKSNSAKGRFD